MIPSQPIRRYGRRRGRRLRPGRQELVDALLPTLRVVPPTDGGTIDLRRLFDLSSPDSSSPDSSWKGTRPAADIWLEIGFGAGEHLAAQAAAHPEIGFIGCEPFINGVGALVGRVHGEGLANVRIFDDDARLLLDALPDAGLGRVFVLFSDPWPKKRHHKRRLINRAILDTLARTMKDGADLLFASDHRGYVGWALQHLIAHPAFQWLARGPEDWRRPPRDWVETRYEKKARDQGRSAVYLRFCRLTRRR